MERWYQASLLVLVVASGALASGMSVPIRQNGFSKNQMLRKSPSDLVIPGLSMQQSYSVSFMGSSFGSQSSGLYLNTLSYRFSIPLTLSVDIGLYNLLYSNMGQDVGTPSNHTALPKDTRPEILFPRISLDYKPTEKLSFSLQILNGPDAQKAYGSTGGFYPYSSRWWEDR